MRYLTALLFLLATTVAGAETTITYQGQLQDGSGPVDATVDMTFTLFDAETDGNPVGTPVSLNGVSVVDGLFQVDLDFGEQAYAGGLWLAIEVENEPLLPRQSITGAPFAISAAAGSGSNWTRSGPHIHYSDGRVGIGTSSPGERLDVIGSAKFGDSTNQVSSGNNFVGGGQNNQASGSRGFVAGGAGNVVTGLNAFVAGTNSVADGRGSYAAGRQAQALHEGSFVWSGFNLEDPEFASTGVDQFLIRARGGVGIGTNSPSTALDVIGSAKFGDPTNQANGADSFVGGGQLNTAGGTDSFVAGGRSNTASAEGSFVGGGWGNTADGSSSFIGGGASNTANGRFSFIGGGQDNTANGQSSFIGGGFRNTADGLNSFVAGGRNNTATGNYSFAAGRNAKANTDGSFVWADSLNFPVDFEGIDNYFVARATGGVNFITGVDGSGVETSGVSLGPGGTSWQVISDRNAKRAIAQVDPVIVLDRLVQMPISEYSYISQDESIRHMGPMAQDFHPLFGLGEDELRISAMNLAGIALAAIQGLDTKFSFSADRLFALEARNAELAERMAVLEIENVELRQLAERNGQLEARLAALEAVLLEDREVAERSK